MRKEDIEIENATVEETVKLLITEVRRLHVQHERSRAFLDTNLGFSDIPIC